MINKTKKNSEGDLTCLFSPHKHNRNHILLEYHV